MCSLLLAAHPSTSPIVDGATSLALTLLPWDLAHGILARLVNSGRHLALVVVSSCAASHAAWQLSNIPHRCSPQTTNGELHKRSHECERAVAIRRCRCRPATCPSCPEGRACSSRRFGMLKPAPRATMPTQPLYPVFTEATTGAERPDVKLKLLKARRQVSPGGPYPVRTGIKQH